MHELEHYELERRARYFDPMGQRSEGVSIYTHNCPAPKQGLVVLCA